jgi:hypothetical protein
MPHPQPLQNDGTWPVCDCGYHCQGDTLAQRVGDAQRHAFDAHGIEVTAEQIVTHPEAT